MRQKRKRPTVADIERLKAWGEMRMAERDKLAKENDNLAEMLREDTETIGVLRNDRDEWRAKAKERRLRAETLQRQLDDARRMQARLRSELNSAAHSVLAAANAFRSHTDAALDNSREEHDFWRNRCQQLEESLLKLQDTRNREGKNHA